jgi:hypothetical protein
MDVPCDLCRPVLYATNIAAFEVYLLVQHQVIMPALGEPIDLDFKAVAFVMDLLAVENRLDTFTKVRRLFMYFKDRKNSE